MSPVRLKVALSVFSPVGAKSGELQDRAYPTHNCILVRYAGTADILFFPPSFWCPSGCLGSMAEIIPLEEGAVKQVGRSLVRHYIGFHLSEKR